MTSRTQRPTPSLRFVRKALRELPQQIARIVEEFDLRAERWQPAPGEWSGLQTVAFLLESEREDAPAVEAMVERDGAPVPERRAHLVVEERDYAGSSMDHLMYDFYELRQNVLWALEYADEGGADHTGQHPYRGTVTLAAYLREMSDRDMEVLLALRTLTEAIEVAGVGAWRRPT